ncbi:hypothetical protein C8Q77DRAFT_333208 [Trametes polyzona]|nr:hypothetical protein C8Q77DRAFT_333208 [Trametes polyzona]
MCDVLVETFSASAPTLCPDFRFTATSAGRSRGVICGLYPSAHVPTTNANVAEQLHAWPEAISKLDARRDAKGVNADGDDWGDASACTTVPLESQAKLQVCVEQEYPLADWSWLELAVVAQARTDMDPFNYQNPDGALGESVLGRIQACAQSVFDYQQRTHQYMVLIFADTARLVYIDRAGMVVTTAFKYATDGDALVKFLWCFARMSPADRGHDPTAERLDPDSAESQKMRERASRYSGPDDYVTQLFKDSLVPDWPWYSLSLWDENDAERKERRFLVGKPHVTTGGLVGQATQGYVALDRDDPYGRLLYLKDTWRALHPDIAKEGATLKFLVENHVRHIPTVECHGDLCQSTVSQECRLAHGFDLSVDVCPIKRLEHCRLVVKEVGMPLETFKSAYDLLIALTCCLRAHADAYKLGILHNGISPGNILLVPDPEEPGEWIGMLHGWGSAKKTTQTIPVARQPDRTVSQALPNLIVAYDPYNA